MSSQEWEEHSGGQDIMIVCVDGMEDDEHGLVHPRKDIKIWYGGRTK